MVFLSSPEICCCSGLRLSSSLSAAGEEVTMMLRSETVSAAKVSDTIIYIYLYSFYFFSETQMKYNKKMPCYMH